MDRLKIKEEREKILAELRTRCNNLFKKAGLITRLQIHIKHGEQQFRLDTNPKEVSIAMPILNAEIEAIGLKQIGAEMEKK